MFSYVLSNKIKKKKDNGTRIEICDMIGFSVFNLG